MRMGIYLAWLLFLPQLAVLVCFVGRAVYSRPLPDSPETTTEKMSNLRLTC